MSLGILIAGATFLVGLLIRIYYMGKSAGRDKELAAVKQATDNLMEKVNESTRKGNSVSDTIRNDPKQLRKHDRFERKSKK